MLDSIARPALWGKASTTTHCTGVVPQLLHTRAMLLWTAEDAWAVRARKGKLNLLAARRLGHVNSTVAQHAQALPSST